MKKIIKSIIIKSSLLNHLFFDLGFFSKFKCRLFLFNKMMNLITGNKHGPHSMAHFTSRIIVPEKLYLQGSKRGTYSSLIVSPGCYIQAGNGIFIGEGTIFAPNVAIISANHDMKHRDKIWLKEKPVKIGKNCWIGVGASILPGVELADGCVVAAGAVVSRSCKVENSVLAGVPAVRINREN